MEYARPGGQTRFLDSDMRTSQSTAGALEAELAAFDRWAETADRDNDGWETWYPAWARLIDSALKVMAEMRLHERQVAQPVARVWSISEETEDLREAVVRSPAPYLHALAA